MKRFVVVCLFVMVFASTAGAYWSQERITLWVAFLDELAIVEEATGIERPGSVGFNVVTDLGGPLAATFCTTNYYNGERTGTSCSVVFLERYDDEATMRFVVAHEIGHVYAGVYGTEEQLADETLADTFAACLGSALAREGSVRFRPNPDCEGIEKTVADW